MEGEEGGGQTVAGQSRAVELVGWGKSTTHGGDKAHGGESTTQGGEITTHGGKRQGLCVLGKRRLGEWMKANGKGVGGSSHCGWTLGKVQHVWRGNDQ
eukprot:365098-Chlamydomonas_euryale.AAC.4